MSGSPSGVSKSCVSFRPDDLLGSSTVYHVGAAECSLKLSGMQRAWRPGLLPQVGSGALEHKKLLTTLVGKVCI